jgi:type VI secretion system secreted protein VgrG
MIQYVQHDRRLAVHTNLGPDALLLTAFSGREEMSRLFHFQLDLLSERDDIMPHDIVGQPVAFRVTNEEGHTRWFNGIINRFASRGRDDRLSAYRASVVPAPWLLTRTADCRIFQQKTVIEIATTIFDELGYADYDFACVQGHHPKREYCVQYRETDFDFISRLLEEEGIFYYFKHEPDRHVMTFGDHRSAYSECPDGEVSMLAKLNAPESHDQITEWEHVWSFPSGRWAQSDFNYLTPSANLLTETRTLVDLEKVHQLELFEYPGEYEDKGDGEELARIRMEEVEAEFDVVEGKGFCCHFSPGCKFKMARHHLAKEEGRGYMLTAVEHTASIAGSYTTNDRITTDNDIQYVNRFVCVPSQITFRPKRITPKPIVHGSQTAIVVGPSGEEIYTDKYGRVKVQFHWDRYGKRDENSSCWIRSSQPWAGKGWGGIQIPRIGQEVIIDFIEGDPDRPIITGRVYNAESMPPVSGAGRDPDKGEEAPADMKAAAMQMSLRSNSLGGSGGHNEITMHDAGGAEKLFIRAQKDEIHNVLNDRKDTVGHDETRFVENDRTREVGNDETVEVGNDQSIDVGNDQTIDVHNNQDITVDANRSVTVKGNETHTVHMCRAQSTFLSENVLTGVTKTIQTGVAHIETIGLLQLVLTGLKRIGVVGLSDTLIVGMNKNDKIMGALSVSSGTSTTMKQGGDFIVESEAEIGLKAADQIVIDCPDITLKSEGGFIRLNGEGIFISGDMVKINSGGEAGNLGGEDAVDADAAGGDGGSGSADGGAGADAPASDSAPLGDGVVDTTSEASQLSPLDQALGNIPGMDPSASSMLTGIMNGEMPELGAVLGALQQHLPANVSQYLDAFQQAMYAYENPESAIDSAQSIASNFESGSSDGDSGYAFNDNENEPSGRLPDEPPSEEMLAAGDLDDLDLEHAETNSALDENELEVAQLPDQPCDPAKPKFPDACDFDMAGPEASPAEGEFGADPDLPDQVDEATA